MSPHGTNLQISENLSISSLLQCCFSCCRQRRKWPRWKPSCKEGEIVQGRSAGHTIANEVARERRWWLWFAPAPQDHLSLETCPLLTFRLLTIEHQWLTSISTSNSSALMSATNQVYHSLTTLIKLCDDVLFTGDKNLSKLNVTDVLQQVNDAVQDVSGPFFTASEDRKFSSRSCSTFTSVSSETSMASLVQHPDDQIGPSISIGAVMAYMEMFGNCSQPNASELLRHSVHTYSLLQAEWQQASLSSAHSCSFATHSSFSTSHSYLQSNLVEFKSEQVAEQMTLLDSELFMKIEIPEVLIWAQEQNEERSPNLTRFTEHFNKMSYCGLVLQDLTFVHIGNSDYLSEGVINFSKRWQQFNIVENMKRFKKGAYNFKKNERIIAFFSNFDDFLCEEAMWQISESIKPREQCNSTCMMTMFIGSKIFEFDSPAIQKVRWSLRTGPLADISKEHARLPGTASTLEQLGMLEPRGTNMSLDRRAVISAARRLHCGPSIIAIKNIDQLNAA
ncbi:unnamed protein product [Nesidiocoris tenuis]|uniref:Ras-GEF domain-containing protein n=1 Tax=Nesidiocoris tenuis TaxID=355587 RepID=A0A6H5GVH9_9HEMI|nr:unnamed protein product [Nesidiocoris tenuis]